MKAKVATDPNVIHRNMTQVHTIAYYAQWHRGTHDEGQAHTHRRKGFECFFPPDLLVIAQDRSDFGWQGKLSMHCFVRMRKGSPTWDGSANWHNTFMVQLIFHRRELGNHK